MSFAKLSPKDRVGKLLVYCGQEEVSRIITLPGNRKAGILWKIVALGFDNVCQTVLNYYENNPLNLEEVSLAIVDNRTQRTLDKAEAVIALRDSPIPPVNNGPPQVKPGKNSISDDAVQQDQDAHPGNFPLQNQTSDEHYQESYKLTKMLPIISGSGDVPYEANFMHKSITAFQMSELDVLIFVQSNIPGQKLTDKLQAKFSRPKNLNIFFGYNSKAVEELRASDCLCNDHSLYVYRMQFSNKQNNVFERQEQLAKLFLVYLILSSNRYTIGSFQLRAYFNYHVRSHMSTIMQYLLLHVAEEVRRDLEFITSNPDSLFCLDCVNCGLQDHQWHLNMNMFGRTTFKEPRPDQFIQKTNIFRNNMNQELQGYRILKCAFDENRLCTKERVLSTLEQLKDYTNVEFTSYLLVLVNDNTPNCNAPIADLFKTNENGRFVNTLFFYAGFTTDRHFRRSHFTNSSNSPLGKMMGPKTRGFVLRNYVSRDLRAVLADVAYVIVQLKALRKYTLDQIGDKHFVVINRFSMSYALLGCSPDNYARIEQFARSNVPVINTESLQLDPNMADFFQFTGNYKAFEITNQIRALYDLPNAEDARKVQEELLNHSVRIGGRTQNVRLPYYPVYLEEDDKIDYEVQSFE